MNAVEAKESSAVVVVTEMCDFVCVCVCVLVWGGGGGRFEGEGWPAGLMCRVD